MTHTEWVVFGVWVGGFWGRAWGWGFGIFFGVWGVGVCMPESEGDTSASEVFEMVAVDVTREQRRRLEGTFVAECPWGHEAKDEYSVSVTYRSQGEAVEVDSFAEYLAGFEDRVVSAEEIAEEVFGLFRECFGREVEVTLYQQNESGVTLTVEMGSCP